MRPGWSVAFVLLAATLAARAADPAPSPNAPLSESARQLRVLQKDEATRQSGMGEAAARDALPSFSPPPPGPAAPLPAVRPPERRPDANANANWLVEGMNQLDKERNGSRVAPGENKSSPAAGAPRLNRDGRTEDPAASSRQPGSPAASDPLAPMMKQWLAGSPVDATVFEAIRKSGSRDTAAMPELARVAQPRREGDLAAGARGDGDLSPLAGGVAPSDRKRENPYLAGLPGSTAPVTPSSSSAASLARNAGSAPLPAMSQPMPGPTTAVAPAPIDVPARTGTRPAPPRSPQDDKKYFPQLKKF